MQVCDLSAACLKNMGLKLSVPTNRNYKDLAGRLGFSAVDVDRMELGDKSNPGLMLLKQWALQDNTTAAVLRYHLKAIGRDDIVAILDYELEGTYIFSPQIADFTMSTMLDVLMQIMF